MSTQIDEQAETDERQRPVHEFAVTVGRPGEPAQCNTVSCDQPATWFVAVDGAVKRVACDRHAPSAVASGAASTFTAQRANS